MPAAFVVERLAVTFLPLGSLSLSPSSRMADDKRKRLSDDDISKLLEDYDSDDLEPFSLFFGSKRIK